MLRLLVWPLLAFAAMIASPSALADPVPARIVAVGDLHGDFDAWRAIARAAGLIDGKGRWAGGNTVLVQLGDVVDRGPDSLKIIRDLQKLQREAPKRGGRFIVLVGNHEAMNMTGDLRYVDPGEFAAFANRKSEALREMTFELNKTKIEAPYRAANPSISSATIKQDWQRKVPLGMLEHQAAWRPDGELGKWVLGNPAVVKLGDTLFVHGGLSAKFAGLPIEEINRQVTAALKRQDQGTAAIINDPAGPLWYRGLISREGGDEANVAPAVVNGAPLPINLEIELVLKNYGVKRIVVGHTPSLQGIIAAAGGRLWRADSAISRSYGGKPSYLEIVGDRVTAHEVARPPARR